MTDRIVIGHGKYTDILLTHSNTPGVLHCVTVLLLFALHQKPAATVEQCVYQTGLHGGAVCLRCQGCCAAGSGNGAGSDRSDAVVSVSGAVSVSARGCLCVCTADAVIVNGDVTGGAEVRGERECKKTDWGALHEKLRVGAV